MNKNIKILPLLSLCFIILAMSLAVGCKKSSVINTDLITATFSQSQWQLNYSNSSGTVEVVLSGEGIVNVILDSIEMRGDNTSASPLKALSALLNGDQLTAGFARNRVLELLANPIDGSTHRVAVSFFTNQSNERKEVSANVTVTTGTESTIDISKLSLEIEPEEWSMNYSKSSGTVEAFIEGDGIDKIDLDSIQLKGDNSEAQPLDTVSVSINGDKIHARFPKDQVLDILNDPQEGSTHQLTLIFKESGTDQELELTTNITIEEDDDVTIDPEDLELEIEPEEWSMNYSKSSGTVEAFIEGEGVEKIDLSTITMSGDNTAATPLAADSASLKGDKIHARFPKNQVLDLLLNPEEGSTHTITITFMTTDNQQIELTAVITIEEDDGGGGGGEIPSNLSLDLAPNHWNFNFSKSGGNVNAFIRGDGLAGIDLDTLEMMGDNSAAPPLEPSSANLEGEHVKGKFAKDQVLDLLLNPQTGSTHTVTVTFKDNNGTSYEVTAVVTVTGKSN